MKSDCMAGRTASVFRDLATGESGIYDLTNTKDVVNLGDLKVQSTDHSNKKCLIFIEIGGHLPTTVEEFVIKNREAFV
jgi:hypothetical protein